MSASDWTEERTELLKRLNAQGKSSGQIVKVLRAVGMTEVTRSAVISKIDRLREADQAFERPEPWTPSLDNRPDWLRLNIQGKAA
jgi:hypothetical protein